MVTDPNDGKQLNDIGLEEKPWGIVVVPDKEEAIVTLPSKNFMQIINTSTMRAEQKIMVPVKCTEGEQNCSILCYSI
jgi:hypothetical protein